MWDMVIQVLGTCGLAATIVEFIYAVTNRDSFTNFERTFFLTNGSFEMLGEVILLFEGVSFMVRNKTFSVEVLQALIKDPVHNLAWAKDYRNLPDIFKSEAAVEKMKKSPDDTDSDAIVVALSGYALYISVLPVLVWASFIPVPTNDSLPTWHRDLFDGNTNLKLALCLVSLGALLPLCVVIFLLFILGEDFEQDKSSQSLLISFWFCGIYAMQKVFEVCIIISDVDRLISGSLGWWLVAFQVVEVLSVALIAGRSLFILVFVEEQEGPQRNGSPPSAITTTP